MCSDKKSLRKEILYKREKMNKADKMIMDRSIINKFFQSSYYKNAKNIFAYISYGSEIDTKEIINKALNDNKRIFVPRTDFKTKAMDAIEIFDLDNLTMNSYGILEPSLEKPEMDPNDLDLIVVPGVAFDRSGGRMGYGAGFYDRFFKKIDDENLSRIHMLVLAYDFQVLDKVPMDEHDVPINYIITEKEIII